MTILHIGIDINYVFAFFHFFFIFIYLFFLFNFIFLLPFFLQARVYNRAVFAKDQQFLAARDAESHIINGEAAKKNQFPYQIGMYMDKRSFCGGSLIAVNWVLTACHCVTGKKIFTVYLGALEITLPNEPGRIVQETRVGIPHEKYNPSTVDNDVALVMLPESFKPSGEYLL